MKHPSHTQRMAAAIKIQRKTHLRGWDEVARYGVAETAQIIRMLDIAGRIKSAAQIRAEEDAR